MAEIYPASVILSILLCHSEAQPKNLCGCSSRLRLLCAGAAALGRRDIGRALCVAQDVLLLLRRQCADGLGQLLCYLLFPLAHALTPSRNVNCVDMRSFVCSYAQDITVL